MKIVKVLMAWIIIMMPISVKMLQSEGQIPEKTVNEASTELMPYLRHFEPIPKIADTKLTSDSTHLLSTDSGDS